jgi:hypothetical protein
MVVESATGPGRRAVLHLRWYRHNQALESRCIPSRTHLAESLCCSLRRLQPSHALTLSNNDPPSHNIVRHRNGSEMWAASVSLYQVCFRHGRL